jgi:pimeloyl-ACP methyl ester carboxylesterase
MQERVLSLSSGEKVSVGIFGKQGFPVFIVGPGSFYIPMFSANLRKNIVFFTFDDLFTCKKGEAVDQKLISKITNEVLVQRNLEVIQNVCQTFGLKSIALLGSSAASLLALNCANKITNIACLILIGMPLITLDTSFKATDNIILDKKVEEEYKIDQEVFEIIIKKGVAKKNLALSDSNFDSSGRLTPNSFFVEATRSATAKVFSPSRRRIFEPRFLQCWRSTPGGKVVNEAMRQRFFNDLQPELKVDQLLKAMQTAGKVPTWLVYGSHDLITPRDEKFLSQLSTSKVCSVSTYKNAGHVPQLDSSDEFDKDFLLFLAKSKLASLSSTSSDEQKSIPSSQTLCSQSNSHFGSTNSTLSSSSLLSRL